MIIVIPFIMITSIAWGAAEHYALFDDVLWRIVFDIAGAISLAFGMILLKALML